MHMTFGELLKSIRTQNGLTLKEFGEIFDVTTTYLSQVENNKKLISKKLLFEIIYYFYIYQEFDELISYNEILNAYSIAKEIPLTSLNNEFEKFKNKMQKSTESSTTTLKELTDRYTSNKLMINKKTGSNAKLDLPFFDLEWLLTQNDYEVFFGRDFFTNEKQWEESKDIYEKILFNKLSDADKKTIHNIIKEFLSNKYKNVFDEDVFL